MDFSNYPPAQLAAMIHEAHDAMRAKIEAGLPASVAAAVDAERVEAEAARLLMEADRATRQGLVLPGFTIGSIEVPPLDLSTVTNLDDVVPSALRDPYNKALFALGLPILAHGTVDEIGTGANLATYRTVRAVHERFSQPDADTAVAKAEQVLAVFEPEEPACSEEAQVLIEAAALYGVTLTIDRAEEMVNA